MDITHSEDVLPAMRWAMASYFAFVFLLGGLCGAGLMWLGGA